MSEKFDISHPLCPGNYIKESNAVPVNSNYTASDLIATIIKMNI